MTLNDIKLNPHNPRQITGARFEKLEEYLEEYGDLSGVVYNTNPECVSLIGGHQRLRVFRKKKGKPVILQTFSPPQKDGTTAAGYIELPNGQRYTYREVFWEKAKADAATIIANGEFGQWDSERLATYFEFEPQELEEFGVPTYVFGGLDEGEAEPSENVEPSAGISNGDARKSLAERFIIPPFSVFDTRQGYWQTRKRQWLALGIKSELGRGGQMTYNDHEWQREKLGKVQAFTGGANIRRNTAERESDNETAGQIRERGGAKGKNGNAQRPETTKK